MTDGEVGRRAALVIGNTRYQHLPVLPNAANDARRMRATLEEANFEVTTAENQDKIGLENAIRAFLRSLNDGDVALFYYSGHAVQVGGRNYILPVDADIGSPYDLELEANDLGDILDYMRAASRIQIAVLDACRDNPFRSPEYFVGEKKVSVNRGVGLAPLVPGRGTLIVYSTAPDQSAYDGTGEISPFTSAFSDGILTPNTEVREILTSVRNEVIAKTGGRQVPWDVSSLTSSFYFVTHRQLLLIEGLREVRAPSAATRIALQLALPLSSGASKLSATIARAPKSGVIFAGDRRLSPGETFDASLLRTLSYEKTAAATETDLFSYTVEDDWGNRAEGVVTVVFDDSAPPKQEIAAETRDADGSAIEKPETTEPLLVSMVANAGTGFAPVPIASASESDRNGWYKLAARSPDAAIAVGTKLISAGDVLSSEDVAKMKVQPAIAAIGKTLDVVVEPAGDGTAQRLPVRIQVAVSENECDRLAAEPLDIQGVSAGVLPNAIDVGKALGACADAVRDYPGVSRFRFQYGRVLYAKGDFADALRELRAAADAGHVRAGHLLGRLLQLGAAVDKDPAEAVALFEAGAERGDPYAQYSLGKALIDGAGVRRDLSKGLALLNKAAESGHTYAMNQLGSEYLSGRNAAKDPERAYRFFIESAGRDDVWGLVNLGLLYRDGVAVGKDVAKARQLFETANEDGHPYAATLLGMLARDDVTPDRPKVLRLFRQSAERGDGWGAYYAAEMLREEPALGEVDGEALRLYALSAGYGAAKPAEKARDALGRFDDRKIKKEVQRTLSRMKLYDGDIDGVLGPKSEAALEKALGKAPGSRWGDTLVDLLHEEWLAGRPRLDML